MMEIAVTNIMSSAVIAFGVSILVLEHAVVTAKSEIPAELQEKMMDQLFTSLMGKYLTALETRKAQIDGAYWNINEDDPVLHISVSGWSLNTVEMRKTQMLKGKFSIHVTVEFTKAASSITVKKMTLIKLAVGKAGIEIPSKDIDSSFSDQQLNSVKNLVMDAIKSLLKDKEIADALKKP